MPEGIQNQAHLGKGWAFPLRVTVQGGVQFKLFYELSLESESIVLILVLGWQNWHLRR